MGIPPAGGCDDGGGTSGGEDLRLPLPEHGCTVYYHQAHYGPVSGGIVEAGSKGSQALMGTGWFGCVGDTDSASGGGTDGGGGRI